MKKFETVIGLEVHVELSTQSKLFCSCSARFGEKPNTNCCPICMGMPGAMPTLNKRVVEYAVSAGLALNCTIEENSIFDRKNYFYPDLPKAYQISQLYFPIARNGRITIDTGNGHKAIGIHELHIEEDAGKLLHDPDKNRTLVDYNRSGVPLIEIVSEPDLRSADEVAAYLDELRIILRYLDVSDCKMQEGSMRVDINLSVREYGETGLGNRTEIKNLNSIRAIRRAIEAESKRQIEIIENGGYIPQETRRWDDIENKSLRMRAKEERQEYRYFHEPDLMPIKLSKEWIHKLFSSLPELRDKRISRYQREYDISGYDAGVITSSREMADLFETTAKLSRQPKEVANWLMVEGMRILKENNMDPHDLHITPEGLAKLIGMIDRGRINRTKAKDVFEVMCHESIDPEDYVKSHGFEMITDDKTLRMAAIRILEENPQAVSDYKNGKEKAMGNLIGQTMKAMKGKADPSLVSAILKELI